MSPTWFFWCLWFCGTESHVPILLPPHISHPKRWVDRCTPHLVYSELRMAPWAWHNRRATWRHDFYPRLVSTRDDKAPESQQPTDITGKDTLGGRSGPTLGKGPEAVRWVTRQLFCPSSDLLAWSHEVTGQWG